MTNWDDIFFQLVDQSSDDSHARRIRELKEAQEAARREAFTQALKDIFLAEDEETKAANALARALRAIVETTWCVPTKPDGSLQTVVAPQGQYPVTTYTRHLIKRQKKKEGREEVLLPLYTNELETPWQKLDGATIVRQMPEGVEQLVLYDADNRPQTLAQDFFASLRDLAASVELEDILVKPAEGQADKLMNATWLVEGTALGPSVDSTFGDGRLVYVYTHQDRVGHKSVLPMKGEKLFRFVAEHQGVDGIIINSTSRVGREGTFLNRPVLSPAFAHHILTGKDIRPGVKPLVARNLNEVELWLELHDFPQERRQIVEAEMPNDTLVRAVVHEDGPWRMQETKGGQVTMKGPIWSPVFVLPSNHRSVKGLGEGRSQILCPGLLAKKLGATSFSGEDIAATWTRGRWALFGRLVGKADRERSRKRADLAKELLKFLPANSVKIPRSALLTVAGANVLLEAPYAGTRAWIEGTIDQAEKFTKPFVGWG